MEQISHALIMNGSKYLAVRSSKDWYWKLPGGRIEIGETPEDALRRELKEELEIQWHPLDRMKDRDQAPSQQILYNKLQELGIA